PFGNRRTPPGCAGLSGMITASREMPSRSRISKTRSMTGHVTAGSCAIASAAAHELGGAARHLVRRHVLDVRRDAPPVAERIFELARPIAVELVLDRAQRP